eukprot:5694641-Pleurochrysis_carterae.AAC.1
MATARVFASRMMRATAVPRAVASMATTAAICPYTAPLVRRPLPLRPFPCPHSLHLRAAALPPHSLPFPLPPFSLPLRPFPVYP